MKFFLLIFFSLPLLLYPFDAARIEILLQNKDWPKAESELKNAISESPQTEWLYSTLIYVLNSQSKEEEAITLGRKSRGTFPNNRPITEALSYSLSQKGNKLLQNKNTELTGLQTCKEAFLLHQAEVNIIWYGIALKQTKNFPESIRIFEEGIQKFPSNKDLPKNLSYTYFDYGMEFLSNKKFESAEQYLKLAYQFQKKDFILFQLAISLREQNKFDESISLLEEGIKQFPQNKYIRDTYPYTRFLKFNFILKNTKNPYSEVKSELDKTLSLLDKNKKFREQYYYQRILVKGLETIGDIDYHKTIFGKLIQILPKDPDVFDHYGFTYYTIKSKDGIPSKEDRMIAINLRKKAIDLYESEFPDRQTILNVSPPVNGRFLVIADFGGSAMTHNGFAKYCYDFMAVSAKGELFKPGSNGKSNSDYYNFDLPLYAIEDGEVIDVINSEPDNLPGNTASSGNYITIQHNGYTSFYAHTKQNSIPHSIGAKVKKGDVVGKAGNSGMSRESHLHFCLNDSYWVSLPFRFKPHKKWNQSSFKLDNEPLREGEIAEFTLD